MAEEHEPRFSTLDERTERTNGYYLPPEEQASMARWPDCCAKGIGWN